LAAKQRDGRQNAALEFISLLKSAPIPRIAIENPVGILSRPVGVSRTDNRAVPIGEAVPQTYLFMAQRIAAALTPTNVVEPIGSLAWRVTTRRQESGWNGRVGDTPEMFCALPYSLLRPCNVQGN